MIATSCVAAVFCFKQYVTENMLFLLSLSVLQLQAIVTLNLDRTYLYLTACADI